MNKNNQNLCFQENRIFVEKWSKLLKIVVKAVTSAVVCCGVAEHFS
jgi:hypothetical protein